MPKKNDRTTIAPALVWQEWAKKRAQNVPSLERVYEISKTIKIYVTQLLLEERHGE